MVQLPVRVKPAQKMRHGRDPAIGEQITIAATPASVEVACPVTREGQDSAAIGAEGHVGGSRRGSSYEPLGAPWKGRLASRRKCPAFLRAGREGVDPSR